MKATGMVRKIDELGRIVIPKEIRQTLRIKNGDSVEMFTEEDRLIIKKVELLDRFKDIADSYCNIIYNNLHLSCFICNNEYVLACNGTNFYGMEISKELKKIISQENFVILSDSGKNLIPFVAEDKSTDKYLTQCIVPIVCMGEKYGAIVVYSGKNISLNENDKLFLKYAANFMCGQIE